MSTKAMNKEKWIQLFRAIGLDDGTMNQWHAEFEARYPAEHQAFLEWLKIPQDEISVIRTSR